MGIRYLAIALSSVLTIGCAAPKSEVKLAPPMTASDRAYYDDMKNHSDEYFRRKLKGPADVVDGAMLNPKIQYHLELYSRPEKPTAFGADLVSAEAVKKLRDGTDANWAGRTADSPAMARLEDRCIPGPSGDIAIRVYWPKVATSEKLPVLVYFHGGGWLFGSINSHHGSMKLIANNAKVIVVSANYRMAPEHKYPAAQDDAQAVFRYVRDNMASIGGDPGRIAIGGDSAGGNMSMSVALRAGASGERGPDFMLLYYPSLDVQRLAHYRSLEVLGKNFGLDMNFSNYVLAKYFPDVDRRGEPDASPLLSPSFKGVPPGVIAVGGFDMLRDQASGLAQRMVKEGIAVDYKLYPSLVHSFLQHSYAVEDAYVATVETATLFGKRIREIPAREN